MESGSKVFTRTRSYSPLFLNESKEIIQAAQQRKQLRTNILASSLDIPYSWKDASANSDEQVQILAEVHNQNKKEAKGFIAELKLSSQNQTVSAQKKPVEDEIKSRRSNMPPVIKCQCNGVEALALLNSASTVSTISKEFARKIRALDEITSERELLDNPFNIPLPQIIGQLKFVQLQIGSFNKMFQLFVVQSNTSDLQLGIDFLFKSKGVINFHEKSLIIGENPKIKALFINESEIPYFKSQF